MIRRLPTTLSLLLLVAASAGAQERNSMPMLNQAIRGGWVQFSLVAGRIALDGSRMGDIQMGPNQIGLSSREQLNIRSSNGDPSMTYEWSNAKEQLNIDISGTRVHIRRAPKSDAAKDAAESAPKPSAAAPDKDRAPNKESEKGGAAPAQSRPDAGGATAKTPRAANGEGEIAVVDFEQTAQDRAVLAVVADGKTQTFIGNSLWHLFIVYPEESRKHLAPLVQLLQPNWKLGDMTAAIETELLRRTDNGAMADRANWAKWIGELADERYATRQAADRSLRSSNPALLMYLQQLGLEQLDAEQQFRIRRIAEALSAKISDDAPEQVASWLAGDASIWLALLSRPDASARAAAAKQLAAILGGPIAVDPHADPATQKPQLEQLRLRIEALKGPTRK